ncbi:putative membrane-spanning 4-domains subfamily A member 12-like isoform 2 [Scophthalmus maximus]|uniref:Putative membrane-spanning 4-domains subfamily A member 12-like isoform 2 n=2 Tax=Scophthalmus maximus TaxID=52904 RepID=A0A2U9BSL4_SCOMX|nr:putative membrane-spanning 4-domains subfamily A member 12-like isoform 2 [Scophthalmus maximus]
MLWTPLVMAVAVSRDLTVQVLEDVNAVKLTDRQQALRAAIQRGEPKCLGVSQVMLGLMVMSYSIPLHFTELTEVVSLGVPWWSGLTFLTAGVVAIILDKNCTMKMLHLCLMVSVVSTVLSVVAVIIYSIDMDKNPEVPCVKTVQDSCSEKHYAMKLSRGMKSSLLLFTLAQTVISAIVCFLLFRQRNSFGQYTSLTHAAPSEALIPPNLS